MENDKFRALIIELLKLMLDELKNKRPAPITFENLIDGFDVKAILKISDRTLYRIKKSKLIHPVRIGKRDYYNAEEIKSLINFFIK